MHEKYLENYWIFRRLGEVFTFPSVDLLEYDSRINYGCKNGI